MAVILPDDGVIFTGDFLVPPYYTYLFACSGENWLTELENFHRVMGDSFGAAWGDTLLLMGHGLPQLGSEACRTERSYLGKLIALRGKLAELGMAAFKEDSAIPEPAAGLFAELCGIPGEPTVRRQLRELSAV
jgi:glyoxylase-like metal-dependent hydrolase (beta-lactamase superfamily II)